MPGKHSKDHHRPVDKEGDVQYWLQGRLPCPIHTDRAVLKAMARGTQAHCWQTAIVLRCGGPCTHLMASVAANLCAAQAVTLEG